MKAVIFDFDGTLTQKAENLWKAIFKTLGYDVVSSKGEYKTQFRDFLSGKINYQEWCDQTCDSYRQRNFTQEMLFDLASKIKLIDGVDEVFKTLYKKDIKICVVSGNFIDVIKYALKDLTNYVSSINANIVEFDNQKVISKIYGTDYDFEGKAKFISRYCKENNIKPEDVWFVGNGDNDEWAHMSGCHTLCVNPDKTDPNDRQKWHYSIENMQSLVEILPIIT